MADKSAFRMHSLQHCGLSMLCSPSLRMAFHVGISTVVREFRLQFLSSPISQYLDGSHFLYFSEGPYCAIAYANTSVDEPAVMPLYYGIWAFTFASANASVIYEVDVQASLCIFQIDTATCIPCCGVVAGVESFH